MQWEKDIEAEEALLRAEESADVQRALAKLSTEQRDILFLRVLLDLTWHSIAIITNKPYACARNIYQEAVQRLRLELQDS